MKDRLSNLNTGSPHYCKTIEAQFIGKLNHGVRPTDDGVWFEFRKPNPRAVESNDSGVKPGGDLILWWLLGLSIRFGMNYGLLSPSRQQIHEFASQQAIESEKTAHRRSPKSRYF